MMNCLAPDCQMGGLGCDNMTVILVCFLNGGTYEELATKCSRPSRYNQTFIVDPQANTNDVKSGNSEDSKKSKNPKNRDEETTFDSSSPPPLTQQ